jgi:hypothetical protein
MVGRFTVRRASDNPDDSDGWGVWDGAANGWRGLGLTEHDAHATADDLDLQYDAHGPRSADTIRRVEPALPRPALHGDASAPWCRALAW